ncbi:MAG: TonB-dependent receptor domain-containing protein [Cyclobacteriaceae bacterium]
MKSNRILLVVLFFLGITTSLSAQRRPGQGERQGPRGQGVMIKGKVLDASTKAPLGYTTVGVFSARDSSLVNGGVSDEAGTFFLRVPPGKYYASVQFLSYQTRVIKNIEAVPGSPVDLGEISLIEDSEVLDEVVVTGEKSQMEFALDKKIFNVGKDLATRGGTAVDILDNIPSVQVDVEGNVSLRGSQSVRMLINGKPSGLLGSDNGGLRQLQSNMIEKVEIITNPSARYEAEGSAGIINIVLKKEQRKGLNGSFDFTVGTPNTYGTAINLNYRTQKLNFFTSYGIRYRKGPGVGSLYQEVFRNDSTFITDQSNKRRRGGLSNNIRFGADYFFNPKNTLTTALTIRLGDDDNISETTYEDFLFNLDNPTGVTVRTDEEREDESNIEYSLSFKREFKKKDHELTLDVRYQDNSEEENSDLTNSFFTPEMTPDGTADLLQRSQNKENQTQLILQGDYVHPFGKEGRFEMGWRSSLRDINNDFLVEESLDNVWQPLEGLSNNFEYDENIHAGYLIYGDKPGKFSYQLGLRPEYSLVSTKLLQTNEINDRDYLNLFPSAHFTFDIGDESSLQMGYSRRVRRPRFWDLNPFFTFSDNRNFFSGNPNLDPEFSHSMEFGHIKHWENASLSSGIYYRHTDGVIERIRRINDDGTSVTQPENLSTEDNYGFEFNVSVNPVKWWRLNGDFNFYRSITDGGNLGASFESDTYTWFTRGSTRFTIKKDIDVQLRFNYRAPRQTTQGRNKSMSSFDLAGSKDVLKDKGTLILSIRDIFNTRRRRYTSEGENFLSIGDFQWRARRATLTFNYRLNQKKRRGGNRGDRGDFEGGDEGQF